MNTIMAMMILAQAHSGRVRGIRDSFGSGQSGSGSSTLVLLLICAAVILVVAFTWLQAKRGDRPAHNAMKLFDEALASLGLSGEEKFILGRMVRELNLRHPSELLLNAGTFDQVADRMVARTAQAKRSHLIECLMNIRGKAFSTSS